MRSPLLPKHRFIEMGASIIPDGGHQPDSLAWLDTERTRIRILMKDLLTSPSVRESIMVASPSLASMVDQWLTNPESKASRRVEHAVIRYLSRMSARSTPFGLFSGCTVGIVADTSRVDLKPRTSNLRHTRIDSDYLMSLVEGISTKLPITNTLRYFSNSSAYYLAGRLRYAERVRNGSLRQYHLSAVDAHPVLQEVLGAARRGAVLIDLIQLIRDSTDATPEEASAFVAELVDNQILQSEILPTITGPEPLGLLIKSLSGQEGYAAYAATLQNLQYQMDKLDNTLLGEGLELLMEIRASLISLHHHSDSAHVIQIDMYKPASRATLDSRLIGRLNEALHVVAKIRGRLEGYSELTEFITSFRRRYEERPVPLMEALDPDCGITFGSTSGEPLMMELGFGLRSPIMFDNSAQDSLFLRKLHELKTQGNAIWHLTDEDIQFMTKSEPPTSKSVSALITLLGPDETGEITILTRSVSASAPKLLGRFAHVHPEINELTQQVVDRENLLYPGKVQAEIAHLPEGRLGNVSLRPCWRDYEIECMGRSGQENPDQILTLDDLFLMIRDDRLVMWSRRLGREVLPRLTTAHNWMAPSNHAVYRFLCAMEDYGNKARYNWDWGGISTTFPFLPRVMYRNIILSRAQWNLNHVDLEPFSRAMDGEAWGTVQALRARLDLPRFILVVESDQELLVDLNNVICVESMVSLIRNRKMVTLCEAPEAEAPSVVSGPDGEYAHEFLVPLFLDDPQQQEESLPSRRQMELFPTSTYLRTVGTEWVYISLYAGSSVIDRLLVEFLRPVLRSLVQTQEIQKWFFIRYADPDVHLRLRLHLAAGVKETTVLGKLTPLFTTFVEQGLVWRASLDTYVREVERYGGPEGLTQCEEIFGSDSEFIVSILSLPSVDISSVRWHLAIFCIDSLLDIFSLSDTERLQLVSQWREMLGSEFALTQEQWHKIGLQFRAKKIEFAGYLGLPGVPPREWPPEIQSALLRWRSGMSAAASRLEGLEKTNRLAVPVKSLLFSLCHMHANRILRSEQRAQEVVIYDFLRRVYLARIAKTSKR